MSDGPKSLILPNLLGCKMCTLSEGPRIRVVPGRGVWPSKVMFVAQSPGLDEARSGKPLIGKTGQLCRDMLHEVGWDLDDFYSTNVNLCHPEGNRKAKPSEVQACLFWLHQQIDTVDPDIIIAMGDSAYRAFLPEEDSPITQIRGNLYEREIAGRTRVILPTIHPSYVARNQAALRPQFLRDMRKAQDFLETGEIVRPVPFEKNASPWQEVVEACQQPIWGFDLEFDGPKNSRGFPVARWADIVGIGVCADEGKSKYYSCPDPDDARERILELKPYLEDPSIVKVVSNAKAEAEVLHRYGINLVNYRDTLVEAWLLGSNEYLEQIPRALKDAWHQSFGTEMIRIDTLIGKGKRQRGMREAIWEDEAAVVEYAAPDPDASLRLHKVFMEMLRERGTDDLYLNVELPFTDIIIEMEERGFAYDPEVAENFATEPINDGIEETRNRLINITGVDFNPNSPPQVAKILYGEDHVSGVIPAPRWDPTTAKHPPTGKEALADHVDNPVVQGILQYRALHKYKSTYLEKLPSHIEDDGRIHCSINQTGAGTGRVSSFDPNLQNIPSRAREDVELPVPASLIRSGFIAEPGNYIYAPDLSQIEMRVAAHLSGDITLIELLSDPNGDVHSNTASFIFKTTHEALMHAYGEADGTKRWKNMRYLGKTIGFGVLYGLTPQGLLMRTPGLDLTLAEARYFIEQFGEAYPRLRAWQREIRRFVELNGYYESLLGRRRYFPDFTSDDAKLRSNARNGCVNFPVQGGAADFFKLATLNAKRQLVEIESESFLVNQVHDEVVMEGPKEELDLLAREIPPVMSTAIELAVPVPVDFEYGDSWGELYEYKATA